MQRSGSEPAESSHSRSGGGSGSGESRHASGESRQSGGGSDELKPREYRDEKGEIHHHTRTNMEDHGGKK